MDEMDIVHPETGKGRFKLNADGILEPADENEVEDNHEPNDSELPGR